MQVIMFSVWDEMGDEGQFSNTAGFEEDDSPYDKPKQPTKWDRF